MDIYDLQLFGIVRVPSLKSLGLNQEEIDTIGASIINWQMAGLLLGGVLWGVLGASAVVRLHKWQDLCANTRQEAAAHRQRCAIKFSRRIRRALGRTQGGSSHWPGGNRRYRRRSQPTIPSRDCAQVRPVSNPVDGDAEGNRRALRQPGQWCRALHTR